MQGNTFGWYGTEMLAVRFVEQVYTPSRVKLSGGALRQIHYTLARFEAFLSRPATLADLCDQTVRQFLSWYAGQVKPATVNAKRRILLALWRCAWEEHLIAELPRKIRRLPENLLPPEAWSEQEVSKFWAACHAERGEIAGIPARLWWLSLAMTAYDTGERRTALFATRTADVSLDGGWVVFHQRKGAPRICRLHADTIRAMRLAHDPGRLLMWPWPFSREYLDERFRAVCRRAGIAFGRPRGGLFHKFRRTSGTLVEANGGDGARHIGDTRKVFERHYLDLRFFRLEMARLPRPHVTLR